MSTQKEDRTWMIVSIAATAALTGIVTFFVQSYLDTKGRVDDRKLEEVSSLIETGQSYQNLSADFMREFTNNDTYDIEREKLRQNVIQQYALVNTAKSHLSGAELARAERYQRQLARLSNLLSKNVELGESEEMIQLMVDVLASEACVAYDLRGEVDLPRASNLKRECEADLK